jgi:hypothetical protein
MSHQSSSAQNHGAVEHGEGDASMPVSPLVPPQAASSAVAATSRITRSSIARRTRIRGDQRDRSRLPLGQAGAMKCCARGRNDL